MSSDYMSLAGAQAVQDISSALLKAAGEVMTLHGNDPNSGAIVAAGFAMALRAIGNNIDNRIPIIVYTMLERRS